MMRILAILVSSVLRCGGYSAHFSRHRYEEAFIKQSRGSGGKLLSVVAAPLATNVANGLPRPQPPDKTVRASELSSREVQGHTGFTWGRRV